MLKKTRKLSLWFFLLAGTAGSLRANDYFTVGNGSRNVFQVVFENPKSDKTTLKPGIYRLNSDKIIPIIKGTVLGANANQSGLHLLDTSSITGRFDALAVVDGKLVFVSTDSKTQSPKSYLLKLGEEKFKARDILSKSEVQISAIVKPDDLTVFLGGPERGEGQLRVFPVIVSIRQPSHFGDGITLAFLIESQAIRNQNHLL